MDPYVKVAIVALLAAWGIGITWVVLGFCIREYLRLTEARRDARLRRRV